MQLTLDLQAPGGPRLTMVGEVDLAAADHVRDAGRQAVEAAEPTGRVVLDVRAVTFLDSTGVGAMVDIVNAASAKDVQVVLSAPPERVRKILEITGLLDRFTLTD